ncbi:MAG TPA: hypothetical protein VF807_03920, partial [Ktedonobacterales bacterium]
MALDATANMQYPSSRQPEFPRVVTEHFEVPGIDQIAVYRDHGGYASLESALKTFEPEALVEAIKGSGLR